MGVSATPEGQQKQTDIAMEFIRAWRFSADARQCAVMVYSDSGIEEELPRVDQYTHIYILGAEFSEDYRWDVHIQEVTDEGKARIVKLVPCGAYHVISSFFLKHHIRSLRSTPVLQSL